MQAFLLLSLIHIFNDKKSELPELSGLRLTSANVGEIISLDDNSKLKTVISVLENFRKSGLIAGVTVISFEAVSYTHLSALHG